MEQVIIIKVGGNIIDDEQQLTAFLQAFAHIAEKKILVHGGGKLATQLAAQLQIPQQMIDGRRITDAATLKIVSMVYAGHINKNIVARLQSLQCNAIGLTGADGNLIQAHQRIHPTIDYGFVGDIDSVNTALLQQLLNANFSIVVAPITHNTQAQLLNTNADTIAQEIATALAKHYGVSLIYLFEKAGVLMDVHNDDSIIASITPQQFAQLKAQGIIADGMLPKLENAFSALQKGVQRVIIGKANVLPELLNGTSGTTLTSGT
ncbi:MAG: acetylglutamate kinase [Bacteroidota bacterium]|jgi:acetylglutamate kinase|nr:acetylglutamate kinase [Bacteroidota bacterium]